MTPVKKTYIFSRFNGLVQCQYPEKVPKDLPPFIREPFNNWYYTSKMKPYERTGGSNLDYFWTDSFDIDLSSNKDSKFYPHDFVKDNNTIQTK